MSTETITVCTDDTCQQTHCCECDAHPGECAHTGPRYLNPIVYEPVLNQKGDKIRLKVPDQERARWDAAPLKATPKPKVQEDARDIDEIVTQLTDVAYIDAPLEADLRTTHALDPLRVSRLAAATVAGVGRGSLTNPGGYLHTRLVEIQRSKTKAP